MPPMKKYIIIIDVDIQVYWEINFRSQCRYSGILGNRLQISKKNYFCYTLLSRLLSYRGNLYNGKVLKRSVCITASVT